ncbi:MAG: cyclopropane fatty acyl phospholipid synthase [Candidatus Pacearchaeota archaeon]
MTDGVKRKIQELLSLANVKINGRQQGDIQVHNEDFYRRVLSKGALGLGESYMDGWWDAKKLDEFFYKILKAELDKKVKTASFLFQSIKSALMNPQSRSGSRKVAEQHYDLSTELYESFLDPYNQYTCGYFKSTNNLNKAQEQKLDLICKKLQLTPKDKVLDIGCGWGGFAKFAAKNYGCHVTGITISDEQAKYARKFTKGLRVKIRKQDYRDLKEKFDKILICGMIEHVGYKNYRTIMEIVHKCLKEDGLFLLHTIGGNTAAKSNNAWTEKYIFPNSMTPSASQLSKAYEGLFVMEDWHNFSAHYDKTLMAWHKNFSRNWKRFSKKHPEYDARFKRMWNYYLLSSAGGFRSRKSQLWQIVLSKNGIPGGYESVR